MNELARQGDRRMTVREVAEVLGISPETVRANGKALYPDLFVNGVTTYLNEEQATAIKLKIQGHHNLQSTLEVQNIKTDLEKALLIKQAMQFQQEIIESLQKENEAMKPKAAFFDQVADSKDALQMRDVAAALNIPGLGRNKIFELLRKQGVLDNRNVPYREYQDRGYFRVIEQKWTDKEGETHINLKSLVYQRGVDFIRKVLHQGGAA
jgi:phage antirepressor YoqD-like protein